FLRVLATSDLYNSSSNFCCEKSLNRASFKRESRSKNHFYSAESLRRSGSARSCRPCNRYDNSGAQFEFRSYGSSKQFGERPNFERRFNRRSALAIHADNGSTDGFITFCFSRCSQCSTTCRYCLSCRDCHVYRCTEGASGNRND